MSLRKSPTLTPALLTARRQNTKKSRGPRTARGKAWSRLNKRNSAGCVDGEDEKRILFCCVRSRNIIENKQDRKCLVSMSLKTNLLFFTSPIVFISMKKQELSASERLWSAGRCVPICILLKTGDLFCPLAISLYIYEKQRENHPDMSSPPLQILC